MPANRISISPLFCHSSYSGRFNPADLVGILGEGKKVNGGKRQYWESAWKLYTSSLNRDVAFPEKILFLSSGTRFSILSDGDIRRIFLLRGYRTYSFISSSSIPEILIKGLSCSG